jgi:hypothetical protein
MVEGLTSSDRNSVEQFLETKKVPSMSQFEM